MVNAKFPGTSEVIMNTWTVFNIFTIYRNQKKKSEGSPNKATVIKWLEYYK